MAFKVRSGKMTFYEEPELLLKKLRQIYSQIRFQKVKGCLSCLVLPMLFFGCFLGYVVLFVGSREPESVFGNWLSAINILDFLTEPAVQKLLSFGIILVVLIGIGFLELVKKFSGTPIDKNRVGPAISCLEFLAKKQKNRKPVTLELDFRQPDNDKFLLEDDWTQTFRQTWLALTAELPDLTFKLEIRQERSLEPDEGLDEESDISTLSDVSIQGDMSLQNIVETVTVILESPSRSLSLHSPATISGLTVEKFEVSKERAIIVYSAEGYFWDIAQSGVNGTQVRTEMFPPLLESLLA